MSCCLTKLDIIGGADALAAASVAKSRSFGRDPARMELEPVVLLTDDTRPGVLLLLPVLPITPLDFDDLELLSLCDEEDDDVDEDGSLS